MSEKRAFALREDATDSFSSAAAAEPGTGKSVVVEDLLPKKGDKPDVSGAIVVDAGPQADALASIPVLKEVPLAEAKERNKGGSTARKAA